MQIKINKHGIELGGRDITNELISLQAELITETLIINTQQQQDQWAQVILKWLDELDIEKIEDAAMQNARLGDSNASLVIRQLREAVYAG